MQLPLGGADVPLTIETRALFEDITPQSDNLDISAIVKRYTTDRPPDIDATQPSNS